MIKYKKDLTCCKAKARFPITRYGKHNFYEGYLWTDRESMEKNVVDDSNSESEDKTAACAVHAPFFVRQDGATGPFKVSAPHRLGELHFIASSWDMEIVSHECYHATTNICRLLHIDPLIDIMYEEAAAYIHGELVDMVYRWLWDVDPGSTKWRRKIQLSSIKEWLVKFMGG